MPDLKLPQLPDRVPVKLTIALMPDLHQQLTHYAGLYREAYGREEALGDLIPAMLQAFLQSDRTFVRALAVG